MKKAGRLQKVLRVLSYIAILTFAGFWIGVIFGLSLWVLILLAASGMTSAAISIPLGIIERRKMRIEFEKIMEEMKRELEEKKLQKEKESEEEIKRMEKEKKEDDFF